MGLNYHFINLLKMKIYQKYLHQFFRDITSLGSFIFYCLLLLLVLAFQEFNLFFKLLFGLIFIMVISVLIRMIYFKHRPKKQDHSNFIEKIDASSFPSIHTARIVFLSLIFIFFFRNNFVTAFFVVLALIVAYSRVYLKKHDWFDLLGGIILALVTYWLTSFF
jgi:undecaprenyl-diphosphatase